MDLRPSQTEKPDRGAVRAGEVVPDTLGALRSVLLLVWFASSFGLMYFARDLQRWAGDVPLSFWLAAQGIVLVFVAIVVVYALLVNRGKGKLTSDSLDLNDGD